MTRRKTGPDRGTVELVRWRDRDKCRRCRAVGEQIHHRKPRGMGGTRDESINSPANLVLLCQACHGWVETFRTEAREQGWLVSQHADPRYQPIDHEGRLTFLTADGKAVPETTTNHHEGDHLMSRKPSTTGTEAMTVEEARQLLGIGRNQAYEAVRRGDIPSLRIGDRILVPRRRLMALINGDVEEPDRG